MAIWTKMLSPSDGPTTRGKKKHLGNYNWFSKIGVLCLIKFLPESYK